MPLVHFKALNDQGELCEETLFFDHNDAFHHFLEQRQFTLISSKIIRNRSLRAPDVRHIAQFLLRLSVLLEAGRPLLDALDDVQSSISHKKLMHMIMSFKAQLKQGISLVQCLEQYPKSFDVVVLVTIDRGMKSGKLGEHIKKAYHYLEQKIAYKNEFKKITLYPLFLFIMMIFLFVGFSVFLLPEVVGYLHEMGVNELPLASTTLIKVTQFFSHYGYILLMVLFFLFLIIFVSFLFERMRFLLSSYLVRLPFLGSLYLRYASMPWLATVGELYDAGIDFKKSLMEAKSVIKNPYIRSVIYTLNGALLQGTSFHQAMTESKIFSPFVISLCDLGMKSGNLATYFQKAYQFEQESLHEQMKKFFGFLEPTLIILMGCLLLWLVMGVILPLYGHLNI